MLSARIDCSHWIPVTTWFATSWILLLPASAQGPRQRNHAQEFGYQQPVTHRPVVEKAIELANGVLNPQLRLPLAPGWRARPNQAVPVYLVAGSGIGRNEIAFVPKGERCVLIAAKGVEGIRSRFDGYGSAGFEYQLEEPLALILLHELGHVYYGDTGEYRLQPPFQLSDVDGPLSGVKDPELRADLFGLSQVRNALTPGAPPGRFQAGLQLNLFLPKISWNLSSRRLLGDFGGTAVRKPALFVDGNTHRNFELRFLVMEYALHRSPAAQQLLLEFLGYQREAWAKQQGEQPVVRYDFRKKPAPQSRRKSRVTQRRP